MSETAQDVEADDAVSVVKIRETLKTQTRRLKQMAKDGDISGTAVLHELYGTVMLIIADTLVLVDRLEDHAEWASGEIDTLRGDGEGASQLIDSDADQIAALITRCMDTIRASNSMPDGLEDQAKEALELIEQIRLTTEDTPAEDDDADDADDDDDDAEQHSRANGGAE